MAQTDTWLDGSGNWDDPTKWSEGRKPFYVPADQTTTDSGPENAVIGGTATETITVSGSEDGQAALRSLTLNNPNASLVITGYLEVGFTGGANAPTYLNVQSGSLIVDRGTLTIDDGSVPIAFTNNLYNYLHAYGTVYIKNGGTYSWNAAGSSAAGQTIVFQGYGNVNLTTPYNGKIVGFTSGDIISISGSGGANVKNVTYSGALSSNQATITYSDNTTSTLQFSVNTILNISVGNGFATIYGAAEQTPAQQPGFILQGLDGDGYANAQQPLSFYYTTGGSQVTFTWSENVGGQAIILEKGGEEAYAYTPTAADAGQEIDISVSYTDAHGVYQTRTFTADVNSLPPAITAPGTVTNKPIISGTGEIGNAVTLTIDGKVIDTSSKPIIVKNNGTWSYTPSTLSDGQHNVSATQQGYAKASDASNTDYFTVDTKAPVIQSVTLDKSVYGIGDTVTAKIQLTTPYDGNGDYTLGSGSTIDGVALTGGTFTAVNDFLYATFKVPAGKTAEVINGSVATHITVNDAAGNTSGLYSTSIANTTIDTQAPTAVQISGFTNGATDTGTSKNTAGLVVGALSATDASPNESFTYTLDTSADASAFAIVNGRLQVGGGANLSAGKTYSFSITAHDLGGNTYSQAVSLTAVASGPTVSAKYIGVAGATGTSGTFKIGDTVTATWDNSASGDNNSDPIQADGVTFDFSQFGGQANTAATNDGKGVWTAFYTITSGNIDTTNAHVSVTATDTTSNATTTSSGAVAVDDIQPTVTAGNISVAGATGTGGTFKIGDTVTATWNNTSTGDKNTDTINAGGVTVDFSQFGGSSKATATNNGGIWTATYMIAAGGVDTTNAHAAVTATDHAGNATTTSSGAAASVDNVAPTVSSPNISLSGGTGTNGAYKIGDTVKATWNDSNTGDNNADTINAGGVTVDFSQFGGSQSVNATDSGGIWTASYKIIAGAGAVDTTAARAAVTATDNAGNLTTASSGAVTADDKQPIVTSGNISVTGGTGPNGLFKIGDTVTASWNNTGGGDNNSDTINADGVTFDLSQFGGGSAVTATNSGGIWTASYKIAAGSTNATSAQASVTVTDHVGNTGGNTGAAVTVDPVPPGIAINVVAGDDVINAAEEAAGVLITGTTHDVSTFELVTLHFGVLIRLALVQPDGTWGVQLTESELQSAGTLSGFTATVQAMDGETVSASRSVAIDTTPPATPGAPTLTVQSDSGTKGDGLTNVTTPTVTGSAAANALVTLYDGDGTTPIASQQLSGGATAYTLVAPLSEGRHALTVTATDQAGNISQPSSALSVTVDTTAPSLTAGETVSGLTKQTTDTISGTVSDANGVAGVHVFDGQVDLGAATYSNGAYSMTVSNLTDGSHAFTVQATDNAGNVATQVAGSVTVDTTAPSLTAGETVSGLTQQTTDTISGTVSDANGIDSVHVFDGNVDLGAATLSKGAYSLTASGLADGTHTFTVKATDSAGNVATQSAGSVTVDTTAPALTAGESVSGFTKQTADTISGKVSDANGVASVHVFDGNVDLGAATLSNGSYSLTASGLAEGAHAFTVKAADTVGNAATTSAGSVTVDTTPPSLTAGSTLSGLTKLTTDTISGTVSDANGIASVHVFDGKTDLGAATLSNGTYSLTAAGLGDGAHSFSAVATDLAGNSTTAAAGGATIDTSTPMPVITSGPGNSRSRYRTISGTSEANASITLMDYNVRTHELSVLGQTKADASGHWSEKVTFAARGAQAVEATATDELGNSATSQAKIFGYGAASYSFFVQTMAAANPQGVGFFAPSPNAQTQEHPLAAPHMSRG